MKLTAIIPHYWDKRTKYLPKIVKALKESTHPPDRIIVINNSNHKIPPLNRVDIVNNTRNWGPRNRHAVALFEPSDLYFTQDDDLLVQPKTIENLIKGRQFSNCLGLIGKQVQTENELYTKAKHINATEINKPTRVDVLVGRVHMFTTYAVLRSYILQQIAGFMDMNRRFEDDLYISHPNLPYVMPAENGEYFDSLNEERQGLHYREEHFKSRNKVLKKLMEVNYELKSTKSN